MASVRVDDPPRYVLVAAGRVVLLAERGRWAEGRFLAVDLDAAFERRDVTKGGELDTIAVLFSADALIPSELDDSDGQSVFEELVDNTPEACRRSEQGPSRRASASPSSFSPMR